MMVNIHPHWDNPSGKSMDLANFFIALSLRMNFPLHKIEEEGINIDKVYLTLLQVYKEWYSSHKPDWQLLALLAVAAASNWIHNNDPDKFSDIFRMVEEVMLCCQSDIRQETHFTSNFTESNVSMTLKTILGATTTACEIHPNYLKISFFNGMFSFKTFNGVLYLHEEKGLYLFDETYNDRHEFIGNIPLNNEDLTKALSSSLWISKNEYQYRRNHFT